MVYLVLEDFFVSNKTIFVFYLGFCLPHHSSDQNKIQNDRFIFLWKGKFNLRKIIVKSRIFFFHLLH